MPTHDGEQDAQITEPLVILKINRRWKPTLSDAELYETTRGWWAANPRRMFRAEYAAGVAHGIIRSVYRVEGLLRDAGDDRLVEALELTDGNGLFVKNLENVQGDERDVVLFSTGFSANEKGQLPLNIGPLNRAGGERRLNVAVTRARRQVVVFSSFDPSALRAEETSSTGIKHLRAYLDVAALGTDALPRDAQRAALPDRHREEVAAALRDRGLVVQTDVGLSDFKVDLSVALPAEPGRPIMAVLLDGPGWAARGTVGDRDGLPVEVLQRMLRWPAVERVWLPEWLAEPERVLDRLTGAASAPPPVAAAPLPITPPPAAPGIQHREPSPAVLDGAVDFVPWQPGAAGDRSILDSLGTRQSADRVRAVLWDGIQAEGPIHRDRLTRLTAGAFGLGRVAEARRAAIAALIAPSMSSSDFVWPESIRPETWSGFRAQTSASDRSLEHVPGEEIGNAVVALCRAGAGMTQDELFSQTLEVFGLKRRTPAQLAVLEAALAGVAATGRLRASGGLLVV